MAELLHPFLFLLILAVIGLTAHLGLRRACRRFDAADGKKG